MILKQIEGYPDFYINDLGQFDPFHAVLSTKKYRGKRLNWMKPCIDGGHWRVEAGHIHVLLAKAFIPNPENKECVHHINGDPLDNRLENLMWVTRSQHRAIHNEGRTISEETRQKISKSVSKAIMGDNNPMRRRKEKRLTEL